ncbi:MAG: D-cysteine desulfhydrase [Flavobacterium sp.]
MSLLSGNLSENLKVPRVNLARLPTPLVPLTRFSKKHKLPTIWLKRDDLTDTNASGNKLRKLEFSIGQALSEGATRLITCGGTQSNHCRATAIIASQLGLQSHLILRGRPDSPIDGNLLLNKLVGADMTFVNASEFAEIDKLYAETDAHYKSLGETTYQIPLGASDEVGLWGYIEACLELKEQMESLNLEFDYLFSASGSGGTAAGLIIGRELYKLKSKIVSFNVSQNAAHFETKISADIGAWQTRYHHQLDEAQIDINIEDGYVGEGYGIASKPVFELIQDLARTEGVILDPVYTAKAFFGLMCELKKGRFRESENIVFLHTGGIFGLFPQRELLFH